MMPPYKPQNPPPLDVIQFGNWVKQRLSIESGEQGAPVATSILSRQEMSLITERLLSGKFNAAVAYRQRLELGREFYFGVRQHLMAVLQVWDAVIDEKDAFDKLGCLARSPEFMEAFLLCTDTIPARVNIGSLGPSQFQTGSASSEPVPFAAMEHELHESQWELVPSNHVDFMQPYGAEALALSDPDAGATTTDDEDEGEEDDSDECEFEDVLPPLANCGKPIAQHSPQPQRPLREGLSEGWESELQMLVSDARAALDHDLSDFDDSTFQDLQSPSPLSLSANSKHSEKLDTVDMEKQLVGGAQHRLTGLSANSKKRKRGSAQKNGVQGKGNAQNKRQKLCAKAI